MTALVIRNGHLIDPGAGVDAPKDILLKDGRVAEIAGPGNPHDGTFSDFVEHQTLSGLEQMLLASGHPVRLRGAMLVGERIQLMHQPFRVHPAQRVLSDVELSGIIAQHHGVAEEFVRLNAAP